jgi:hypothetical protein
MPRQSFDHHAPDLQLFESALRRSNHLDSILVQSCVLSQHFLAPSKTADLLAVVVAVSYHT